MLHRLERKTDFPIFSAATYKNKIFVSGGGGGQKFGVPNYITAIDAATMMESFRMDTGDDLIEKIYANEVDDYLIAISEQNITIYGITEKGTLVARSNINLHYKEEFQTLSSYCDNTLAIAINKELMIYSVKDLRLNKIFEISIDSKINHLVNIGDPHNFFVSVENKIMVFSVKNTRFISEIPIETKGKGLFILEHKKSNSLLFVISSHTETKIRIYEKLSETFSKCKFIAQSNVSRSRVTIATILSDIVVLGDINGNIDVFKLFNTKVAKLLTKKVHELPPNNIILKRMPSTAEDDSLLALTFGADYKISVNRLSGSLLARTEKSRMDYLLYLLIVLVIAMIAGVYFGKR